MENSKKNLFYYEEASRYQVEGGEERVETKTNFFNMDMVVRGVEHGGRMLILLNDFHEELMDGEVIENKKRVIKKIRQQVSSTIPLEPEDAERFRKLFEAALPSD